MPKLVRALLVLALGAAVAAPVAKADPTTTYLDALRTAIAARLDSIPPNSPVNLLVERAALAKSLAAFGAGSRSIDGDLRILQRMAKPIEGLSTLAPTTIPDELLTSYLAFRGLVGTERDALPAAIDALVDPRARTKAQAGLDAAEAALVLADASALTSGKTALLRTAHAAIAKAAARIARATAPRSGPSRPGRAYVACFVDETPFAPRYGGSVAGADGGAASRVTITGYGPSLRDGALEISWDSGALTGPGTYALDGTSGALVILVADGSTFMSESGSIVVTEFDPASHRIAGTFSGTVTTGEGASRFLSGGAFATSYAIAKR